VAPGKAVVALSSGNGSTPFGVITLTPLAPALFTWNSDNLAAAVAVCVSSSGAQTAEYPYRLVSSTLQSQTLHLGACAETVRELYGTGLDNAAAVQVSIGPAAATVLYAGAQGTWPGLDRINVVIPQSLAGSGTVPVVVSAGGMTSNTVNITVQ